MSDDVEALRKRAERARNWLIVMLPSAGPDDKAPWIIPTPGAKKWLDEYGDTREALGAALAALTDHPGDKA